MMSQKTSITVKNLLIFLLSLSLFECAATIIILFLIPPDPNNAWLFGYSTSRWMLIGVVILLTSLLTAGILVLTSNQKFSKFKERLPLDRSVDRTTIVNITGLCLIVLILYGFLLYFQLDIEEAQLAVFTRVSPVFLLGLVLSIQTIFGLFCVYNRFLNGKKFRYIMLGIIIITPFLITFVLLDFSFQASILDYIPRGSDSTYYWREIGTFSEVGFKGGQYSIDEQPARASFTHFGTHGPVYPMLYGTLGKLFGWHYYSGIIINITLITIAIILFLYLTLPDNSQLIQIALLLITFWPMWVFLPSMMQQSLHITLAILMAGLFYLLMTSGKKDRRISISLFIIILLGSLLRFSWVILFIPFFLILMPYLSWKNVTKALILTAIPSGLAFLFQTYFYAPYPGYLTELLLTAQTSISQTLASFYDHFIDNVISFFTEDTISIIYLLRYQILVLVLVFLYLSIKNKTTETRFPYLFNLINLGVIFTLTLLFYETVLIRDYRVFAPHIFLSLLLLILFSRQRILILGVIFSNVILITAFFNQFIYLRTINFEVNTSSVKEFQDLTSEFLLYEPAQDHWCNTIDLGPAYRSRKYSNAPSIALAVPRAFGVSKIQDWGQFYENDLLAQYVIFDPMLLELEYPSLLENLNLMLLVETPRGNLYQNLNASCD